MNVVKIPPAKYYVKVNVRFTVIRDAAERGALYHERHDQNARSRNVRLQFRDESLARFLGRWAHIKNDGKKHAAAFRVISVFYRAA